MAVKTYVGSDGKAKRVKKMYVGVGGSARRVKKAYVGDANGKARLVYSLNVWEKWSVYYDYEYGYYFTDPEEFNTPWAEGYTSPHFNSSTGTFSPYGATKTVSGDSPGSVYIFTGSDPIKFTFSRGASKAILTYPVVTGPVIVGPYKGSTYYGDVYGDDEEYPDDGEKGGYWYVRKA